MEIQWFLGGLTLGILIGGVFVLCLSLAAEKHKQEIEEKIDEYWIEHFPLKNKYIAVYKSEYVFLTAEGQWKTHSTPSIYHLRNSKEEAEKDLKEFLEWYGKDVKKLKAII